MADTFQCSVCKKTFEKGWSDEEAQAELAEKYPGFTPGDCDLVCDDCQVFEMIRLVGGPADGRVYEWLGGDLCRCYEFAQELVHQRVGAVDTKIFRGEISLYRRSLRNRNLFVYQP